MTENRTPKRWPCDHYHEYQRQRQFLMKILEAHELVDQWINSIGVRYFNELTNTALLMEEVGEVARVISP